MQEDYENKNTGNDFMFEFRYSNMLTVLAVAYLYSGGMPIMYPVGAVFFFLTYWFDKCLLFNCYRRPIKFDNYLSKRTLGYFKYILMGHIAGFLLMYGFTPILQSDSLDAFLPKDVGIEEQDKFSLFPYYFWLILALLISYAIWITVIRSFIKLGKHCCGRAQ